MKDKETGEVMQGKLAGLPQRPILTWPDEFCLVELKFKEDEWQYKGALYFGTFCRSFDSASIPDREYEIILKCLSGVKTLCMGFVGSFSELNPSDLLFRSLKIKPDKEFGNSFYIEYSGAIGFEHNVHSTGKLILPMVPDQFITEINTLRGVFNDVYRIHRSACVMETAGVEGGV